MNTFTDLEERYIQHYMTKYTLTLGQFQRWLDGLRNRSDELVNIEGTHRQRMDTLKAEAERRYMNRKRLERLGISEEC